MNVLVINAGSSSLKYQLLNVETHALLAKGICERVGSPDAFHKHGIDDNEVVIDAHMADHDEAMALVLETLTTGPTKAIDSLSEIDAVGHRIVQGGKYFDRSVIIDDEVIAKIDELAELAPLHNKAALMGIHACQKHMPGVPMVAVFDSAFFQSLPPKAYMYPLPYELYEKYGIRKYGAHGTSHRFIWRTVHELMGDKTHKLVSCHLGSGASLCAIEDGQCMDTTMGLTPLDGLIMGTRTGTVDPATVFYLNRVGGYSIDEIDTMMNKQSGLLAVSGVSSDSRDIEDGAAKGDANYHRHGGPHQRGVHDRPRRRGAAGLVALDALQNVPRGARPPGRAPFLSEPFPLGPGSRAAFGVLPSMPPRTEAAGTSPVPCAGACSARPSATSRPGSAGLRPREEARRVSSSYRCISGCGGASEILVRRVQFGIMNGLRPERNTPWPSTT